MLLTAMTIRRSQGSLGLKKAKPKRTLTQAHWMARLEGYMLAAVACDQWTLATAYAHKANFCTLENDPF